MKCWWEPTSATAAEARGLGFRERKTIRSAYNLWQGGDTAVTDGEFVLVRRRLLRNLNLVTLTEKWAGGSLVECSPGTCMT